jgi:small multidrug resistance pump
MTWLLLGAAIVCELGATMALRASDGLRRRLWIPVVLAGYAAGFGLLALALERGLAVGVAYGIWAACGVALTAVSAHLVFGDPLNRRMGVGLGLIAVGILLVRIGAVSH